MSSKATTMQRAKVVDAGDLRKYRIEIPNLIDDLGLDPYTVRLYMHLKRVAGPRGACWQSTRTLAEHCKMSAGKVSQAKRILEGNGLVTIEEIAHEKSGKPYHLITIVDIWLRNFQEFSNSSPREHQSSPDELQSSPHELQSSPDEIKKEPIKKEPKEEKLQRPANSKSGSAHPEPEPDDDCAAAAPARTPVSSTRAKPPGPNPDSDYARVLREYEKLFGPLGGSLQYERFGDLWDEFPQLQIHAYARTEMYKAMMRDEKPVSPNLRYYAKCLQTGNQRNWKGQTGGDDDHPAPTGRDHDLGPDLNDPAVQEWIRMHDAGTLPYHEH